MTSDTINLIDNTIKSTPIASLTTSMTTTMGANMIITAQEVVTDWQFFTLIVATLAFVFIQPQIYGVEEFYKSCFHRKNKNPDTGKREVHNSRIGPPRWVWFDFWWNVVHACLSISIILYVWNYKFPSTSEDQDKYATIEYFFIVMIILEKIWRKLFWNWHYSSWAQVLACIIMGVICLFILGMGIAFAIVGNGTAWVGFALFLFVALPWYLLVFGWNIYICICYWKKTASCRCHDSKLTERGGSESSSSSKHRHKHRSRRGYEYHSKSRDSEISSRGSINDDDTIRKRTK